MFQLLNFKYKNMYNLNLSFKLDLNYYGVYGVKSFEGFDLDNFLKYLGGFYEFSEEKVVIDTKEYKDASVYRKECVSFFFDFKDFPKSFKIKDLLNLTSRKVIETINYLEDTTDYVFDLEKKVEELDGEGIFWVSLLVFMSKRADIYIFNYDFNTNDVIFNKIKPTFIKIIKKFSLTNLILMKFSESFGKKFYKYIINIENNGINILKESELNFDHIYVYNVGRRNQIRSPFWRFIKLNIFRIISCFLLGISFCVPLSICFSMDFNNVVDSEIAYLKDKQIDYIRAYNDDGISEKLLEKYYDINDDLVPILYNSSNRNILKNTFINLDIPSGAKTNFVDASKLKDSNYKIYGNLPNKGEILLTDFHFHIFKNYGYKDLNAFYKDDSIYNISTFDDLIGKSVFDENFNYFKVSGILDLGIDEAIKNKISNYQNESAKFGNTVFLNNEDFKILEKN